MPKLTRRIPSYRLHKASGQAVVTLNGRDHYLGPHNTESSRRVYERLVAEWLANHRQWPATDAPTSSAGVTIDELILAFWQHAEGYYVKNGKPTSTLDSIRVACRPLNEAYGDQPATDFGPLKLKAVRQKMIDAGHSRVSIGDVPQ